MSDAPRDERELNAGVELHVPSWLPGGKAMLTYRRIWDKRLDEFSNSVTSASSLSMQELEARVLEADVGADILATAAERAQRCGDSEYIDLLGRLVAAALIDPARLDPVAYLIPKITQLEPIHIRILVSVYSSTCSEEDARNVVLHEKEELMAAGKHSTRVQDELQGKLGRIEQERSRRKDLVIGGVVRIDNASVDRIGVDPGLLEACLTDLADAGFIDRSGPSITRLGRSAATEIARVRDDIVGSN